MNWTERKTIEFGLLKMAPPQQPILPTRQLTNWNVNTAIRVVLMVRVRYFPAMMLIASNRQQWPLVTLLHHEWSYEIPTDEVISTSLVEKHLRRLAVDTQCVPEYAMRMKK